MRAMANTPVKVEYNQSLKPLEDLLSKVKRPGDFFVTGSLEAPMPTVEVGGVGVLSFPVPAAQVKAIIRQAVRAPYGRGEATILDTSVRKVWQVSASRTRVRGTSWGRTFQQIVSAAVDGLGCSRADVSAVLYKLLVYDKGSFFKGHRDTEKADGMFATLVVALPSAHRGGELLIRHGGREATVDLSGAEPSDLRFAAFYADCEHEVRPITEGNRVCLVYNLVQGRGGRKTKPFTAPVYDAEVTAAARLMAAALTGTAAPVKIAWLLEHQYSPAGLSFAALKNADAARAKVLSQAALRAGCAVHLGIVHIEEYGSAEPSYGEGYDRRSRWGPSRYDDEDLEDDEDADDAADGDFEIVDVSDGEQFVDSWVGLDDRRVEFGPIPLDDGELLPAGALDGEKPDSQRVTEATGNEGASFERSYHRAAVVVWRRDRYPEVLLRAGVGAAIPYLEQLVRGCEAAPASRQSRRDAVALVDLMLDRWEKSARQSYEERGESGQARRAEMLAVLCRLGERALLDRFITRTVIRRYNGSENRALIAAVPVLGAGRTGDLFSVLAGAAMRRHAGRAIELLAQLVRVDRNRESGRAAAPQKVAAAVVAGLPNVKGTRAAQPPSRWSGRGEDDPDADDEWEDEGEVPQQSDRPDAVADLMDTLGMMKADTLRRKAAAAIASNTRAFDPVRVVIPALSLLGARHGRRVNADAAFRRLWRHAAEFLLTRSEQAPPPPTDWKHDVTLSCRCEDCRELQAFGRNGAERMYRFRVKKERRRHLHETIQRHRLDMTHVTERKGSPQTLVCTKTRGAYERRSSQYRTDIAAMGALLALVSAAGGGEVRLSERLRASMRRAEHERGSGSPAGPRR
jgi:hypothetical protein